MRMLSRLLDTVAPEVCHACEGGSGLFRDPDSGQLRLCSTCAGSGKASMAAAVCQAEIESVRSRREAPAKTPRSVA